MTRLQVARCIRRARVAKGWSQSELAKRIKLTPQAVSFLESGGSDPRLSTLRRIAKATETTLAVLVGGVA